MKSMVRFPSRWVADNGGGTRREAGTESEQSCDMIPNQSLGSDAELVKMNPPITWLQSGSHGVFYREAQDTQDRGMMSLGTYCD